MNDYEVEIEELKAEVDRLQLALDMALESIDFAMSFLKKENERDRAELRSLKNGN